MLCPYCQTTNRDDRETCYQCDKDLSMLRLIVNKAKHHFNQGLEFAERDKLEEAIQEMRNAIELDASLTDAYVVQGSLLAKQERYDEARECWRQALETNPQCRKAHEYLGKVDDVAQSAPVIKRLQNVVIGTGAAALLFLVLAIILAISGADAPEPTPDGAAGPGNDELLAEIRQLHAAIEAIQTGDGVVASMPDDAPSTPAITAQPTPAPAADRSGEIAELRGQIEQLNARTDQLNAQLESQVAAIGSLLALAPEPGEDPEAARRIIDILTPLAASGLLPAESRQRADALLDQAWSTLTGGLDTALAQYQAQEITYEEFQARADELAGLAPPGEIQERMEAARTAAAEEARGRLEAKAQADAAAVRQLIEAGEPELAQSTLDAMVSSYEGIPFDPPADLIEELKGELAASHRWRKMETIRMAWEAEQWERYLTLTEDLDGPVISGDVAGWEQIVERRRQALSRLAAEGWAWFEEHNNEFVDNRISEADSARAVEIYRRTIEHLPENLSYAVSPILFYAASAQLKLGHAAEAVALLDEYDQSASEKNYMRPFYDQFRERFADELTTAGGTP